MFDQDGHPVVPTCAAPVPSRAGAVQDGRRPPRSGAARVLDRHEHDGTINAEGRPSAFAVYARILTAANKVAARDTKRLGRRLTQARLRQNAAVEDTNFRASRGLDRALFHKLAGCDWIRQSQHLVISGPTGVGKSWLACALGHKACREGFSVLYRRAPRLFADLAIARGEGRLSRTLAMLERTKLLIIDDWGPEPLTAEQRRDLLEIVDDRYEKGSLLITSQIAVGRWHELIGDPTMGDAILDRVVHRAHRLELKGPSLRKRDALNPASADDAITA